MTPIRVILVDDHPLVTEGVRAVLETYEQIAVIESVTNGHEAVSAIQRLSPDVTLMDLNMRGMNGLTATELVLERDPCARIIILSMHDNPEYISTALRHRLG